MTLPTESSPSRSGASFAAAAAIAILVGGFPWAAGVASAQGNDRTAAAADFVKEPGGTLLGRLSRGAAVTFGASRGGWREVTIDGWIEASALRKDTREGFDVAVNLAAGTPVRSAPEAGGSVRATARAGVLFREVGRSRGWVQVRRTAWVIASAAAAPEAPAQPGPVDTSRAAGDTGVTTILGGSILALQPGGAAAATTETPIAARVVERRQGWTRVVVDAWVRDAAVGTAAEPGQITAQDLRDNPERHVGQTVEWRLQLLALRKADELRPELPPGQTYALARGPLPETGFVYLAIPAAEVPAFQAIEPLTEIRVRATVRSARTRYLPTPVLEFVRKLD